MAQIFQPSCPRCGTPGIPGQRFCSSCGATLDVGFSKPTASASSGEHYPQVPDMPTELAAPPPPPTGSYNQPAQGAPNTYYPPQAPQGFPQGQQSYQSPPQPLPAYSQPPKDSTKSVLGQISCGVGVLILLILAVCGGTGYLGYRWLTSVANSVPTTTTSTGSNIANNGTPATVPLTTKNINEAVTFASAEINILNAQEASSFSDDSNTSSPVLMRLNLKEQNPTADTIYVNYSTVARLILPDNSNVTPTNSQQSFAIAQAVTRTNWVDFPLSRTIPLDQLKLQLGTQSQAQMLVPLTGSADLGAYKSKMINTNTRFQYAGLNWTLTTVTSSLSAAGNQANSGMRYIVVTLKADNPTSNTFYPSATTYMRLKSGDITNSPTDSTLPFDIAPGTTGATGTVTFQMSQDNSSFTLIMLARADTPPVSQVTTNFQI